VNGLLNLIHECFDVFMNQGREEVSLGMAFDAEASKLAVSAARFLLGASLLLGARGLVGVVNRLRDRGSTNAPLDGSQ
ncbi:MAG: hypothetical protein M3R20_07630, partial [Pseudomonadota bacterium]|nr:hypothetical protein [Pseudomonadota bacterium]